MAKAAPAHSMAAAKGSTNPLDLANPGNLIDRVNLINRGRVSAAIRP
ncbi:hypothetical protein [Mesorhizobium sp. M9A.F.Ca.ET.002.03.1.2]|nr:hypothetical protein [Mesorhizobium sp. M9A.F.Ca.ET.002.03.1.2]